MNATRPGRRAAFHRRVGAIVACALAIAACLAPASGVAAPNETDGFVLSKFEGDGSLTRVQKKGELVIGSSNDWPYSYLDAKTGAFKGIDADIIDIAAKMLGIKKVTVQTVPFDGLVPGVLSGRFDMVGDSIHATPARSKLVAFSFPTYYYAEAMVVKKGSGVAAKSLDDMKGKSVGSILGTNYTEWIQKTPGLQYKGYKDPVNLVEDVASGRVDAGLYDLPVIASIIKDHPQWHVEIVPTYQARAVKVPANYSRYIFRQQDQQLTEAFSRAIEWMQYTGRMKELLKKHGLGEEAN
jgi:polar amino acid transport system substrate-binding protein